MIASESTPPAQRIQKVRRDYNTWVANETLEDYALRFTPRSFRKWSEALVANTAFGAASFLVLEAVGATMLVQSGFINTLWAVLATGLIIFLLGLPISVTAARHGLDMDLLTRGAGFGYIGSTMTSLIYASFTFIFFALEAAIMAYALELAFGLPPAWGYLICALVVIPLVTHGVTAISRLQVWTQPLWLFLLVLPYAFLLTDQPEALQGLWSYGGEHAGEAGGRFNPQLFGAALTVGIALVTQMAEQVDYLRFMPEKTAANSRRWWFGVIVGGPGWVLPGVFKMLGGAVLAWLAMRYGMPVDKAVDPNRMYFIAFTHVFSSATLAIVATAIFVIVSQLKINVTNAYAGSLAWSNFFARLTHSHPGRVVWVVFNTLIALMLMELGVFQALGQVLGLYSNIAISWMAAVVADLVINKPLGLSPKGIEFKRSHLYDINPVGVGAMLLASLLSIVVFMGVLGETLQPYASFVALGASFVFSPLIAWLTGGRYYLARPPAGQIVGSKCAICERDYEPEDMAHCPAYQGAICSLCCSLDARCHDLCKPEASLSAQWHALLRRVLPRALQPYVDTGLGHYLLLMAGIVPVLGLVLGVLYTHELYALTDPGGAVGARLQDTFAKTFAALLMLASVIAWWMVLTQESRRVAQEESNRQTQLLMQEIDSHRRTDSALQQARQVAEQANQAKSRYISAISHELRTPLNSILGYAQILATDETIPKSRRQAVNVIRKSGDHLLSVIEGTLDIARIEGGKLSLEVRAMDFREFVQQIVDMFELQARSKGLNFDYRPLNDLPAVVRCDEKRVRQIIINVLGNAVKFTQRGSVAFSVEYRRDMAIFEISDTGPGIPDADMEKIFEPFVRGSSVQVGGSGVGLTIARMLTNLMGGEMTVASTPGEGTRFRIRLFLPQVHSAQAARTLPGRQRVAYTGARRRILVVDNERVDRELLQNVLQPLGFVVGQAANGYECLAMVRDFAPDLIFVDLGMPGIDGWETIRRLRQQQLTDAVIAVLSANAFEKGQENDVGITTDEFLVKPIKVNDVLDWIGRKLDLEWVTAELPAAGAASGTPAPTPAPLVAPDAADLAELAQMIELGYPKGILHKLSEIEEKEAAYAGFVSTMEGLARQFQFDAMKEILRKMRDAIR